MTQKGQVPKPIVSDNNPLGTRQTQYQSETKNPLAFKVDMGGKMPDITLETKRQGTIGSTEATSQRPGAAGKELRDASFAAEKFGVDQNFHDQYVDVGSITTDEGRKN